MSFTAGDHVKIQCVGYTHHGLYVGNGMVIHKNRNGVDFSPLEEFSEGSRVSVVTHSRKPVFTDDEAIERAFSRIGEDSYNLVFDNCEHFVMWCKFGVEESKQVKEASSAAFGTMFVVWKKYKKGNIPDSVMNFFAQNPSMVKQLHLLGRGTSLASGQLLTALASMGFAGEGAVVGTTVAGMMGSGAVTAATLAAPSGAISGIAAGTAMLTTGGLAAETIATAAVATTAVATTAVATTTAATTTVATAAVATVAAATVAAPIVAAVGISYGIKKIYNFFWD